jgi:Sec-independent protein translocase protein TatA
MFARLFQPIHLPIVFGITSLVFGPRKLPGIGEGVPGFSLCAEGGSEESSNELLARTIRGAQQNRVDPQQQWRGVALRNSR